METQYYNAKPSRISNIGADVSGAKRMNFDTYENPEEKAKRKAANRALAEVKARLKDAVLLDAALRDEFYFAGVADILRERFELEHEVSYGRALERIEELRTIYYQKLNEDNRKNLNKLVNAYNSVRKQVRYLTHGGRYAESIVRTLAKKYQSKESFTEETGSKVDWKDFATTEALQSDIDYLKDAARAVQFGNTVTDNERAYICSELTKFLKHFAETFPRTSLKPISWSFGARGKAGSVAYYEHARKVISVNRNNIGSLIHEIGHFIDARAGNPSSGMSYQTRAEYRERLTTLNPWLEKSKKELAYYMKPCEMFARAFEAWCLKHQFSNFAQSGSSTKLPELNLELELLITNALVKLAR